MENHNGLRATVVIPTLDEERTIEACLASVGTRRDVEVVVSDGGSRDGTLQLLSRNPGVTVVSGPPGRGMQLNRGAKAAHGPVLLFLHADCRLPQVWLASLESALANSATVLACFLLRTGPASSDRGGACRRAWLRLLDLRSLGLGLPYGDQGFGMRRETYDRVGGFPDIPLMEDVAMARACRRLGRIERLPYEVWTSARRFEKQPIRTRLMTATFPWMYRLGVSSWRLAAWYRSVR